MASRRPPAGSSSSSAGPWTIDAASRASLPGVLGSPASIVPAVTKSSTATLGPSHVSGTGSADDQTSPPFGLVFPQSPAAARRLGLVLDSPGGASPWFSSAPKAPGLPTETALALGGPSAGHGEMMPGGIIKVLYAFAGKIRHCDLRASLQAKLRDFRKTTGIQLSLDMVELDTLRGGASHDLSTPAAAKVVMDRIIAGEFDVVVTTPPCNTHSRVRHSNKRGPPPLRDRQHPRGLPDLSARHAAECATANALVDLSWDMVEAAVKVQHQETWRKTRVLMEHPEDLGESRLGCPASLWDPPRPITACDGSVVPRYAAFQCAFGPLPYAKPTGLLCDCPGMGGVAFRGWPRFIPGLKYGRRTDYIYAGPLLGGGHDCGHSNHTSLQRQSGDRYFRTLGTAAWAAGMCDTLAGLLIDDFVSRWPHAPLKMGSEQGAGTTVTTPAPPGEVASRGAPSDAAIAAHAGDRKRKLGSTWARHPLMAGADLSDDEEIAQRTLSPIRGWDGRVRGTLSG